MRCVPTGACAAYRSVMALLQRECGYSADNIPQLEDVSRFMHREWPDGARAAMYEVWG